VRTEQVARDRDAATVMMLAAMGSLIAGIGLRARRA
jgi:hypothetical protein